MTKKNKGVPKMENPLLPPHIWSQMTPPILDDIPSPESQDIIELIINQPDNGATQSKIDFDDYDDSPSIEDY